MTPALAILPLAALIPFQGAWQRVKNPDTYPVLLRREWCTGGACAELPLAPVYLGPGETRWVSWPVLAPGQEIRARSCWVSEPSRCSEPSNARVVP